MNKENVVKQVQYTDRVIAMCPYDDCNNESIDASTDNEAYRQITDNGMCTHCGRRIER